MIIEQVVAAVVDVFVVVVVVVVAAVVVAILFETSSFAFLTKISNVYCKSSFRCFISYIVIK